MQKRLRTEGGDWSKLVQTIRQVGYNKGLNVEFAVVKTPPPALVIELERDNFPIDTNDNLYVAEHLTEHTRKMTFSTSTGSGGTEPHTHAVSPTEMSVTIHSALEAGDRVIVLTDEEAATYTVLDKAVIY